MKDDETERKDWWCLSLGVPHPELRTRLVLGKWTDGRMPGHFVFVPEDSGTAKVTGFVTCM